MSIVFYLLQFLTFVPKIVGIIETEHADKTLESKTKIAADWMNVATEVATKVLPPGESQIAATAGAAAQSVLAATVSAIHDVSTAQAATSVDAKTVPTVHVS